ncbi:MAG: sensor histidine kinase [Cyanobacteriota bacterium]
MQVSKSFLSLLQAQLHQFSDCPELRCLAVYLASPGPDGRPHLVLLGQWPPSAPALPPIDQVLDRDSNDESQRWLPLRQGQLLLGAMRVDSRVLPWPPALRTRLQAAALCLTEALCLDIEQQRLSHRLLRQDENLRLLVHQLRNPLTALRTFGQLLLRRLEPDSRHRPLVEGLLAEQTQLNRYIDAIGSLASEQPEPAQLSSPGTGALLLPPSLNSHHPESLDTVLRPLLDRAAATASLQGRLWQAPNHLPAWWGDAGSVAEIIANLLENAFRYSRAGAAVGLWIVPGDRDRGPGLCLWDGGETIETDEREAIFEPGRRGRSGMGLAGTGLGLALARDLARSLGGDLQLVIPPCRLSPELPPDGNAFMLQLPLSAAAP